MKSDMVLNNIFITNKRRPENGDMLMLLIGELPRSVGEGYNTQTASSAAKNPQFTHKRPDGRMQSQV